MRAGLLVLPVLAALVTLAFSEPGPVEAAGNETVALDGMVAVCSNIRCQKREAMQFYCDFPSYLDLTGCCSRVAFFLDQPMFGTCIIRMSKKNIIIIIILLLSKVLIFLKTSNTVIHGGSPFLRLTVWISRYKESIC